MFMLMFPTVFCLNVFLKKSGEKFSLKNTIIDLREWFHTILIHYEMLKLIIMFLN